MIEVHYTHECYTVIYTSTVVQGKRGKMVGYKFQGGRGEGVSRIEGKSDMIDCQLQFKKVKWLQEG